MVQFIPAAELKCRYEVLGHFYTVEVAPEIVVNCRSVLELVAKARVPNEVSHVSRQKPDAVCIMMNPGSSQPLVEVNNHHRAEAIHNLPVSLVPTKPDTTQYQVMRLMHYCGWQHVRVLNLSDLRCSKSTEFFKQFNRLEAESAYESHSIFSQPRKKELAQKLTKQLDIPVIQAWGLSDALNPLIERCMSKLGGRTVIKGLQKEGMPNKFLHPLPSVQSQQIQWVNRMVEQCIGAGFC